MNESVLLNGELVPEIQASISVYDGGWLHGAGLFETMRAEHGRVFRLENHLRRLMNSAARLLHPIDRGRLPSDGDCQELMSKCDLREARLRLTVSAGSMLGNHDGDSPLTVCVNASPLMRYENRLYQSGASVIVSGIQQSPTDPLAGHKSTCYLPRLLALREAQSANCLEAIWFSTDHRLLEGSISNVFLVRNGKLKTPPVDAPVLPGIMRAAVLEIAAQTASPCAETQLNINDLLDADEVFLTNTMMQIMPVVGVEKHTIGDGRPGPVTTRLRESINGLIERECTSS